jgi:hypothetical protein
LVANEVVFERPVRAIIISTNLEIVFMFLFLGGIGNKTDG